MGDADALLSAARAHHPDIVVTDVRMPPDHGDDGLRAARVLREDRPDLPILLLSQYIEQSYAAHLLDLGGDSGLGYLLKDRVSAVAEFAEAVARVNPLVRVVRHPERVTAANALDLLAGYDLVLDGTDNFPTRYLVGDACAIAGKPLVWGSILRFDGQYSVFWGAHGPTYRDLYPVPPAPGTVPNCAEAGVLGVLPGLLGTAMAVEAVKLVTGIGTTMLGRVATYDALSARWWEIPLAPTPGRAPADPNSTTMVSSAAWPAGTTTGFCPAIQRMPPGRWSVISPCSGWRLAIWSSCGAR